MPLSLILSHNLFLTRQQCYDLYDGNKIEIVGVNVAVWIHKGNISEPATEVFSEYELGLGEEMSIYEKSKKYFITLPKSRGGDSEEYFEHLFSAKDLLDFKDYGAESLNFRQLHTKKSGKKSTNFIHYIEIKRIEDLLETLS